MPRPPALSPADGYTRTRLRLPADVLRAANEAAARDGLTVGRWAGVHVRRALRGELVPTVEIGGDRELVLRLPPDVARQARARGGRQWLAGVVAAAAETATDGR